MLHEWFRCKKDENLWEKRKYFEIGLKREESLTDQRRVIAIVLGFQISKSLERKTTASQSLHVLLLLHLRQLGAVRCISLLFISLIKFLHFREILQATNSKSQNFPGIWSSYQKGEEITNPNCNWRRLSSLKWESPTLLKLLQYPYSFIFFSENHQ